VSARSPWYVANWKMNLTPSAARVWCEALRAGLDRLQEPVPELGVAPPLIALDTVRQALRGSGVVIGAQNCHAEASGAFTGEVSAEMLADAACRFVLVGHSERRHLFGENDEEVGRKAAAAVRAGIEPLICVGEKEEQREAGQTPEVLSRQLDRALEYLLDLRSADLTLAYEPVWAIGTGRVADASQIEEAHAILRGKLVEIAGEKTARTTRILYGGSVTPQNAEKLAPIEGVDGFLIGGASLDAARFLQVACPRARC